MKTSLKYPAIIIFLLSGMLVSCKTAKVKDAIHLPAEKSAGIYYWKTTFNIGDDETAFLKRHSISRLYLRMFDVDVKVDYAKDEADVVPIATTVFASAKPDNMEIIPTVFITLNALNHYEGNEPELARKIVKRILNMCDYNNLGKISEIQFDCDWTMSSARSYRCLCETAKEILHAQDIILSGTIRLHQIEEAEYPFDRGVLMLYNTGAIKDPDTGNSILAYCDVEKYLGSKERVRRFRDACSKKGMRIDCAYPTFRWNVAFDKDGTFDRILPEEKLDDYPNFTKRRNKYVVTESFRTKSGHYLTEGQTIRPESPSFQEIQKVKELVGSTLGPDCSNIIYHLDISDLSNYSDNEIERILR